MLIGVKAINGQCVIVNVDHVVRIEANPEAPGSILAFANGHDVDIACTTELSWWAEMPFVQKAFRGPLK